MNNILRNWLEAAPHFKDCASIPAQSERACTCGKREALEDFEELENKECPACVLRRDGDDEEDEA